MYWVTPISFSLELLRLLSDTSNLTVLTENDHPALHRLLGDNLLFLPSFLKHHGLLILLQFKVFKFKA